MTCFFATAAIDAGGLSIFGPNYVAPSENGTLQLLTPTFLCVRDPLPAEYL